jgi:hypothetical protein
MMTTDKARAQQQSVGAPVDGARVVMNQRLVGLAERALERAVTEQVRPPMGMYVHPSSVESAAFERAVNEICRETHRLDLRAEELLIAIKNAWAHLAPVRARHLGDRDGDVLREVVSNSIEVFFAVRDERVREVRRQHEQG